MNEYTLTRNTSSSRGRVYEKKISQQYVNKGDLFSGPKSLAKNEHKMCMNLLPTLMFIKLRRNRFQIKFFKRKLLFLNSWPFVL